jgi:hypothetical protein
MLQGYSSPSIGHFDSHLVPGSTGYPSDAEYFAQGDDEDTIQPFDEPIQPIIPTFEFLNRRRHLIPTTPIYPHNMDIFSTGDRSTIVANDNAPSSTSELGFLLPMAMTIAKEYSTLQTAYEQLQEELAARDRHIQALETDLRNSRVIHSDISEAYSSLQAEARQQAESRDRAILAHSQAVEQAIDAQWEEDERLVQEHIQPLMSTNVICKVGSSLWTTRRTDQTMELG